MKPRNSEEVITVSYRDSQGFMAHLFHPRVVIVSHGLPSYRVLCLSDKLCFEWWHSCSCSVFFRT